MTDPVPVYAPPSMDPPPPIAQPAAAAPRGTGPGWAIIGIFLILTVGAMALARAFLLPVVLAILLQMVFTPVRRQLERWGISPGIAAGLIFSVLVGALAAGIVGLAGPTADLIDHAPEIGRELRDKFETLKGATESVRDAAEEIDTLAAGEKTPGVQTVEIAEHGNALSLAMSVPAVMAQVLFTLVLLLFLLASGDMFYEKLVYVLPTFRDKRLAVRILYDIEQKLSRYLFTISVINAALGVTVGLALWYWGMPNAVIFGITAALLNFIPYVGAVIGVGATFLIGAVTFDTLTPAIGAAATYLALTSIEGQFITPYFVGRSLRLNTVVVFLAVTLFAWLWSAVGMLVATPLLVALRALCEHIPSLENLGHFLSERGAETESDAETQRPLPPASGG